MPFIVIYSVMKVFVQEFCNRLATEISCPGSGGDMFDVRVYVLLVGDVKIKGNPGSSSLF